MRGCVVAAHWRSWASAGVSLKARRGRRVRRCGCARGGWQGIDAAVQSGTHGAVPCGCGRAAMVQQQRRGVVGLSAAVVARVRG
jgi:hypothetical protein